jgi:hypothetical protein
MPWRARSRKQHRFAGAVPALFVAALLGGPSMAMAGPGQSFEDARDHWAYQPIVRPAQPRVRAMERVRSPVDAFLLARLEAEGLTFGPTADPRTLLRRVYYDLIGLPPTYEEVREFARDPSREALAEVVDRLLADPRYGERWARHWLDVARYADTKDLVLLYGKDALRPYAYTYRDYVIRAFNEDLPYDQFIRDQIGADLVEPRQPPWRLAALGFLTLGRLFDDNPHDQIDDQIDTVTRGLLGLTVACARCHDHKYDAITTDDYYGLYGVFASTERPYRLPLIESPAAVPGGPEFEAGFARRLGALESHIDSQYEHLTRVLRERLPDYLIRAATTPPDLTETTQFALSLTPDDFRPALMLNTRRLLQRRVHPGDRLFGLWAELADLPGVGFALHARELIARAPSDPVLHRNRIVTAHLADSPPSSMQDVFNAYAELLRNHHQTVESRLCDDEAYLETEDERELTQLIYGETSPIWFAWRDTPDHMSRPDKDRYNALVLDLDKFAAHASNPPPARAMVVADLPTPYESRVFTRGNPSLPGHPAPRAFLRVLTGGEVRPFTRGSGRLELAAAIASPDNPLTARVLVNRVWMHHFGEPIVASTADFGTRSEPPTLPLLLDWLASEFIQSGWSLKHLHRTLILSSAYQLATPTGAAEEQILPSHAIHRHGTRRRLDLEAMRDTLLFVSGQLDSTMGGRPVDLTRDPFNRRRTIYGLVDRQNLPALYRAFDFAAPDQCVERRPRTTVPQQALFALNSPVVIEQARALARAPELSSLPPTNRVGALFRRVLGRDPTSRERERALSFLDQPGPAASLTPWEQFTQVLLISNEALFLD